MVFVWPVSAVLRSDLRTTKAMGDELPGGFYEMI